MNNGALVIRIGFVNRDRRSPSFIRTVVCVCVCVCACVCVCGRTKALLCLKLFSARAISAGSFFNHQSCGLVFSLGKTETDTPLPSCTNKNNSNNKVEVPSAFGTRLSVLSGCQREPPPKAVPLVWFGTSELPQTVVHWS